MSTRTYLFCNVALVLGASLLVQYTGQARAGEEPASIAEVPVRAILTELRSGRLALSTRDFADTPGFQCEVHVSATAGDRRNEGFRILLQRDQGASGAVFSSRGGFPYAVISRVQKSQVLVLGLEIPGTMGLVDGGELHIQYPEQHANYLAFRAGSNPVITIDLETILQGILARFELIGFDAPTRSYQFRSANTRAHVIVADRLEHLSTGSPLVSVAIFGPEAVLNFRQIRIGQDVVRSPTVPRKRIEIQRENLAVVEFGTPEADRLMKPIARADTVVARSIFDKPETRRASLVLLDSMAAFLEERADDQEKAQITGALGKLSSFRWDDEWQKNLSEVRSILQRVVVRPTLMMELDENAYARQEYRREWACDIFEVALGPVFWNAFYDAAAQVIPDTTRPLGLRLKWLDLLGEVGLPCNSPLLNELDAWFAIEKNAALNVVLSSVKARTEIPNRKEMQRLLEAVDDESLPLDVRGIALEAVCLRHGVRHLDLDRLWRLLPKFQGDQFGSLPKRILLALLVDPEGLRWIVRSHGGKLLTSLGPGGLRQIGARVREVRAQSDEDGLAHDYLAHVRKMALEEGFESRWRAAACAEGGWGPGGLEFASKMLPGAATASDSEWRIAAFVVMRDAGVGGKWLAQVSEGVASPDAGIAFEAARTLHSLCCAPEAGNRAEELYRIVEQLLRRDEMRLVERGLQSAWHLVRRGHAVPEPLLTRIKSLGQGADTKAVEHIALAVAWQARFADRTCNAPLEQNGDLKLIGRAGWWRENASTLREAISSSK